jgi:nicotinamidase-related amidase
VSPHRVFGPQTNDLVLQLRKRRISKLILGVMLANMCVESHLRDLLEQGFETVVAKDATAAPRHPEWGYGYAAALINFEFLAHAVDDKRDSQSYGAQLISEINARSGHQMSLRLFIFLQRANDGISSPVAQ